MEKISYDELYANAYNKSWSGWKKLGKIMEIVERLGSKSRNYPYSKVKHALNFLNTHLVEKRVKDKLHLNWNGEDHDGIYVKRGDAFPDFVDANGETYELKERWSFEEAMKCDYYGADHCLLHLKSDNCLYEYNPVLNCFDKICLLRAPYVDIKRYPFEDADLGI